MAHDGASSVIPGLWVPVFLLAHLFSGYWLVRAALLTNPSVLGSIRRLLRRGSRKEDELPQAKDEEPGTTRAESLDTRVLAEAAQAASPRAGGRDAKEGRRSSGAGRSLAEVERIELEWQALSCCYSTNTGKKWVLKDVYGVAHPGEMQALLGPSGAGKSTLMDMLARRKSTGMLSGAVLVDGVPADGSFIRRTAYVPQYDNFVPVMSTREVMMFYAGIILPRDWSMSRRAARVEEVLQEMGLAHAHKTLVGGQTPGGMAHRGLSGGERKRLCIATGILAAPSVVFLDEPTTGLDSFAALTVMGYMKRMARDNGHIVITSIHQPRSAIWSMFDTVTLLSCGRLMYTGICDGLVEWFSSIGFDYNANLHGVVSDWALDLVACGSHKPKKFYGHTISTRDEVRAVSAQFLARYLDMRGMTLEDLSGGAGRGSSAGGMLVAVRKPPVRAAKGAALQPSGGGASLGGGGGGLSVGGRRGSRAGSTAAAAGAAGVDRATARAIAAVGASARAEASAHAARPSSWAQQFWWALRREVIIITRNPADVAGRVLTNCWIAVTMGLMYYDMTDGSSALKGKVNMLLNILAFFCLMPYISMSLYSAGKQFYLADVSAKLYTPSAYYLAKVCATLPFQVIGSLVFTFVLYGMAGLRNDPGAIWVNGIIGTLMSLISIQVMHLCVVIAPTQDVAFMYSIAWTAIQLLFNNFFITFKEVTLSWLTQLRWLSAMFYAFEGMAVVEFGGVKLSCAGGLDPGGLAFLRELLPNTKLLGLKVVQRGLEEPGEDCVTDASAVLEYFNFGRSYQGTMGILLAYWLATHTLTFLAMVVVARKERR